MQPQTQPVLACPDFAAEEGLEQPRHGLRGDGGARVGDPEFELSVADGCEKVHGTFGVAVDQGVGQQVRHQLGDPARIESDRSWQDESATDDPAGFTRLEFLDNLAQHRLERRALAVQVDAAAEAASSEVHDVVDQASHPVDACLHEPNDVHGLVALHLAAEQAGGADDGGEGIPKVVTENRDELFSEVRRRLLVLKALNGGRFAALEVAFIAPSVLGPEEREPNGQEASIGAAPLPGVDQHRRLVAARRYDVERDLLEPALQSQKRCDVGLVEDAPWHGQKVA